MPAKPITVIFLQYKYTLKLSLLYLLTNIKVINSILNGYHRKCYITATGQDNTCAHDSYEIEVISSHHQDKQINPKKTIVYYDVILCNVVIGRRSPTLAIRKTLFLQNRTLLF